MAKLAVTGQGAQQGLPRQQQSVQPASGWQQQQPQQPGLQQLLQLQGHKQQVFSEQCLQQVDGLMAAATRGTGGTMFMMGWGSCWDTRTGSPTIVMASALQLLRSKTDPHALQLLGAALDQMESMVFPTAAAVWFAELLLVAVTASNAEACQLLCSRRACQHIPVQHLSNMLMLAVQQLEYSNTYQRQQRMAVLQHVCSLFSRLAVTASREWFLGDSGDAAASRVAVRQVLAFAVQAGDEQALQELLGVTESFFGSWRLLKPYDLYILVLMSLRVSCKPRIIKMLCSLQLSSHSSSGWSGQHTAPAFTSMSGERLYDVLNVALTTHKHKAGVSEIVQLLAAWDPRPAASAGRFVTFTCAALGAQCAQALKIGNADERAKTLVALCWLGTVNPLVHYLP